MNQIRKYILVLGDIVTILLAFYITFLIRFGLHIGSIINDHAIPFGILIVMWLLVFYIVNLYEVRYIRPDILAVRQLILALALDLGIGFLLFYLAPFSVTPKTNLVIAIIIFGALIYLWRRIFFQVFANRYRKLLVIVGDSEEARNLVQYLTDNPHIGYIYQETIGALSGKMDFAVGTLFILTKTPSKQDLEIITKNNYDAISIREAFQNINNRIPISLIDEPWVLTLLAKEDSPLYSIVSRGLEILIAGGIIIIASPFILLSSIAIFLYDRGPIFYTHERIGKNKTVFKIIKLRSMIIASEESGAQWAGKDDKRITPIGRILRATHIDEVPQMLNVLKGDMALVGPRPERPIFVAELEEAIPYYMLRQRIKPGFTGWAQIKFHYARSVMDSQEKFEYDLFYIENRTLLLDIGILLKTVQIFLQ